MHRKVIVVNDANGHGHAITYNTANMRKLLELVLEANDINTMMEDPDKGRAMLADDTVDAEAIESFMQAYNGPVGRSAGGMIHFVVLQSDMNFPYNPFT